MRKIILVLTILILATLLALYVSACGKSTLYPETGKVVEICNDTVSVETSTGNIFEFYGSEDWFVDDIVSMIMDSCGTTEITDDMIIAVKYSGVWKK